MSLASQIASSTSSENFRPPGSGGRVDVAGRLAAFGWYRASTCAGEAVGPLLLARKIPRLAKKFTGRGDLHRHPS